ncbi:MAG: hypothetical protein JJO35_00270 [Escherichia coli]|uniref:hypothetical protein n=1 Tax=Escherichia coli TaxID=562 RepID=UPI0002C8FC36|nr:hypothetical protein [Escherichia coli]EFC4522361.1 hypothetical protein [Escherichia coli]EFJ0036674.1 hypothetical protein [Escherichia coli]ENC09122.1 putative membrane protein [Escherichia coli P0299438.5]MBL0994517.1 hypothetical protein [Escherichia coli]
MKIKRTLLIMLSRFIRGAGMGLGASGIVFTVWFFFLSSSEYKYLWGGLSVALFFVGYLMYRFAYAYIYDEWDDYQ